MRKDFDKWNTQKKVINDDTSESKSYHTREIWWCKIGLNIGFEQDGKDVEFSRPVLILKSFSRHTCLVAPLTTSNEVHKYRIDIGDIAGKRAKVIISQMKVIDTKRFIEKVGFLGKVYFEEVIKNLKALL